MAVVEGVDYANPRPSGEALAGSHKQFVIRYLSPNTTSNPGKTLTRTEVVDYRTAGLDIGLVWETTTGRATAGHAAGVTDAMAAERVRSSLGAPSTVAIYFAVDQGDITGTQVAPYFQGVASVLGLHRTGVYGSRPVLKYLFDHGLIGYGWQTYAWSLA